MSTFKEIRERLGATQHEMAEALGCTQGNVSLLDRGQTVLPATARKLIDFAASRGLGLTMDHVYGVTPLPAPKRRAQERGSNAARA
jgi:transcriptional regulator with XRE-family HTH domain